MESFVLQVTQIVNALSLLLTSLTFAISLPPSLFHSGRQKRTDRSVGYTRVTTGHRETIVLGLLVVTCQYCGSIISLQTS